MKENATITTEEAMKDDLPNETKRPPTPSSKNKNETMTTKPRYYSPVASAHPGVGIIARRDVHGVPPKARKGGLDFPLAARLRDAQREEDRREERQHGEWRRARPASARSGGRKKLFTAPSGDGGGGFQAPGERGRPRAAPNTGDDDDGRRSIFLRVAVSNPSSATRNSCKHTVS